MTVFGTVLKIDSIKNRTKKLKGIKAGLAKWMTNVRNKRADSESTLSLQPRANGLIKSFERRQTENPLLLYLDRDCLLFIKGFHFWF